MLYSLKQIDKTALLANQKLGFSNSIREQLTNFYQCSPLILDCTSNIIIKTRTFGSVKAQRLLRRGGVGWGGGGPHSPFFRGFSFQKSLYSQKPDGKFEDIQGSMGETMNSSVWIFENQIMKMEPLVTFTCVNFLLSFFMHCF